MVTSNNSVLGLVELADADDLIEMHGSASFNVLRDVFHDRLKDWVRPKDQWRLLKNNRICVILKDIGSEGELELAAAKLGRIFKEPHYHLGRPLPLEVAAGFAELNGQNKDMKLAMQQAGIALKQAKKSSQLFDVYSPQFGMNAEDERKLVERLELALELGELQLYYQPKVHAGYRSLIGAEALMRWHTKDRKVIMPDQFIDVAERNEVIKPMTWWTIKSAVARLARWPEELAIAVNISPVLLMEDDILSVVQDALEIHGVTAARLNLEVTESIMVDNQNVMLTQLARLRDIGVKISIDDFGTGFSSLAYFRDLPVDEIKIDKSFVMRMLESEKDHAIVKAVIDLAHNFSLKVVAEGVESMEIAERLADMRCDILQGYVFDKPLPVEEFERQYRV
jgi:EAL domain-containing protein (putative c-di-GMP-specific phosphodiesterase class I)/GGDEF domain-containing protein